MSRTRKGGPLVSEASSRPVPAVEKSQKPAKTKRKWKFSLGNSFRLQRKRDRPVLSPLTSFRVITTDLRTLLQREWRVFLGLGLIYAFLYRLFIEGLSQLDFNELQHTLSSANSAQDKMLETSVLVTAALDSAGGANTTGATLYAGLLTIVIGLCIVWAARQTMAGRRVKIRDALYNGPGPLLPTLTIVFVIFLQALPVTIGIFVYNAATSTGIVQGGAESMVIFIVAALSALLSCYWLSSTLIALMLATLPGMYPWHALLAAKDMVAYRRWQLFLKIAFFAVLVAVLWLVVVVITVSNPITRSVAPWIIDVLRGATLVVSVLFMYKLYRSLVDGSDS